MQSLYDQFDPPEFDPSLLEYSMGLSPMGNNSTSRTPVGLDLIQEPVGSPMAVEMMSRIPGLREKMSGQTPDMPEFKTGKERAVYFLRGQKGLDDWRKSH